jgi:pilus assembly protein Flp/PilA
MVNDPIRDALFRFLEEEDGPTTVEYGIMLALIVVVCMSSVSAIADRTGESFDTTSAAIEGAFGN